MAARLPRIPVAALSRAGVIKSVLALARADVAAEVNSIWARKKKPWLRARAEGSFF